MTRCDSWCRDETGRIVANWPGYMREYEQQTRGQDPSEFRFRDRPRDGSANGEVPAAAGSRY